MKICIIYFYTFFLAYHEIARWCSSLLSVAVINSLDKRSLERKGLVSPYSLRLSREAKAGTEVETTEECCLLAHFPRLSQFPLQPRPTCLEWH